MSAPDSGTSNDEVVSLDRQSGLAQLTINRPDSRNALNSEVLTRLRELLTELRDDDSTHAVIFTGAGTRSFVAGADINELAQRQPTEGLRAVMQHLYDEIESFEKPTIAAINGYAFGGGFELALACDIRVASTAAQFALPETGLGIIPSAGGTQRLARILGVGRATELILTGRRVSAEQALQWGLVTELVESEELSRRSAETARTIVAKGPVATYLAKTVIRHGFDADQSTGMLLERLAQSVLFAGEEKQEGVAAFTEKRSPEFPRTDLERGTQR